MEQWTQIGSWIQSARRVHIRSWTDFLFWIALLVLFAGIQRVVKKLFPNAPQGAVQVGMVILLFLVTWIYLFVRY